MTTILAKEVDRRGWRRWAEPNASAPFWLHLVFGVAYFLLLSRLFLLFVADDTTFSTFKKAISLLYEPFYGVQFIESVGSSYEGVVPAVLIAIISFGLLHLAIATGQSNERQGNVMNFIVSLFRMVFYLMATLFLLLVTLRLAVMTYRDLAYPSRGVIIRVPAQK